MTEQVSEQRFEDFKAEFLRAITDLKETLGGRISELTGKIEVYSQMAQNQSIQAAKQEAEICDLKKHNAENSAKLECNSLDIKALQTTIEVNQRHFNRTIIIITVFLSVLTLILKFFNM